MPNTSPLLHLSQYWTYVVGNRLRFTDATRATLQRKALEDVNRMEVSTPSLDSLISGGLIEVSMPYEREDLGWEYRTCPWESFLSLATKVRRRPGDHLTVVRHLRRRARVTARAAPASLLVVVSTPGKLRESFDFSRECELVQNAFASRVQRGRMFRLNNPSAEDIRRVVIEFKPDIIHLAGVDAHQKALLLGEPDDPMRFDGFVLRGEGGTVLELNSEEMGRTLTADGRHAPRLVSFNCYNSAARLAGLAVAHGAASAVGFQDTIDDAVAEQFFANLYTAWEQLGWERLAEAFALSREQVALTTESRNSGDVVLWNSASVFAPGKKSLLPQWVRDTTEALRAGVPWLEALSRAQQAPPRRTVRVAVSARRVSGAARLEVNVTPLSSLNYSLLHNRRGLFDKFQITAPAGIDRPLDVDVNVELCVGENAYPVRGQFAITGPVTNLHERIHLPLVAALLRGKREGIVTTLAVEVLCAGRTLHRETYPLRLRPPDEWTDEENDQADQCWLPSFILPRDPAVQHIVEAAQRYLQTLADDSSAGFDGYQRLTREGDDPEGAVESQVRALWSALLYEKDVDYINPPPTYTAGAQRVRTPSQIFEEGRGTCIDVALLFCACLEYVGLMPVMFLVPGHAFPGYWRSPPAREQFWNFVYWRTGDDETFTPERQLPTWLQQRVDAEQMDRATALRFMQEARPSDTVREPWMVVGEGGQAEVTRALQSSGLVPLETTLLTSSGSFRQAQDLGVRNLVTPWGFEAMVEIQRARDEGVTPLPLLNQET